MWQGSRKQLLPLPTLSLASVRLVHERPYSEVKDRHEILPLETFRLRLTPGYLEAYRERTGAALDTEVSRLRAEVATVRSGKEHLQQEAENIREILKKKTEELEGNAVKTEDTINQALQEIGKRGMTRSQSSEASWPDCWLRRKTGNWRIALTWNCVGSL